jgi:hypothetical protein
VVEDEELLAAPVLEFETNGAREVAMTITWRLALDSVAASRAAATQDLGGPSARLEVPAAEGPQTFFAAFSSTCRSVNSRKNRSPTG